MEEGDKNKAKLYFLYCLPNLSKSFSVFSGKSGKQLNLCWQTASHYYKIYITSLGLFKLLGFFLNKFQISFES